jgi:hypothetical protein
VAANVQVNAQLPAGFRLAGVLNMTSGTPQMVAAVAAGGGAAYFGNINTQTRQYLVVVPAGTYNLTVCHLPDLGFTFGATTTVTYQDPTPVQVTQDTTRDVAIPAVTVRNVTGTVAGLPDLSDDAVATVRFNTANGGLGGTALVMPDGSYAAKLPAGAYTASIGVGSTTTSTMAYNVGAVTVAGADVAANFTLPAMANLSGAVQVAGMTTLQNASVSASDTSAPAGAQLGCSPALGGGFVSVAGNGAYQVSLVKGRTYLVNATVPISTTASLNIPKTTANVNLPGDVTRNFVVGALPTTWTISGQVTGPDGKGVPNVSVTGWTDQISGVADASFQVSATTDANGNYQLTALAGSSYTLEFSPPTPTP